MRIKSLLIFFTLLFFLSGCQFEKEPGKVTLSIYSVPQGDTSDVWVADNQDGTYKNPILYADYSDPDVIRVGEDYFMVSSSFNCVPALPVLHSKDLVNWTIIGNVFAKQEPLDVFDKPQHGNGVWAPSIRYHKGEFYIYYGDPDYGIYMTKARDVRGQWTKPHLVKEGKGWIDPCPLWDNSGKAYLVHAWAGSRAGIKSILTVHEMSKDGKELLDDGVIIFDGHVENKTVEGPKFYKKDGYYYVFAPAGGVEFGWQLALRSKNPLGPYESKVVLNQGKTSINGPHQGAWVDTKTGENWFIHFQDKGAYGRITHLQPMNWIEGWPVIGVDNNSDGVGEPVMTYKKPNVGRDYPLCTPVETDEFNSPKTGLQWQWHANSSPKWGFPSGRLGYYRLNAIPLPETAKTMWEVPNILAQKFPAPEFTATTKIQFFPELEKDKVGLIILGEDYAYVSVEKMGEKLVVKQAWCLDARTGGLEKSNTSISIDTNQIYFRVIVSDSAMCDFSYSVDSLEYISIGKPFQARQGRWIGAKVGLFCVSKDKTNNSGYANIDWFRINK